VEAVANLSVDLSWIVVVKAAKGEAVVQQDASVRDIQGIHSDAELLADVSSQRQIGCGVRWKVGSVEGRRRILKAVGEAGTVVDVERSVEVIGKIAVEAYVKRIALIVVERRIAGRDGAGG